ncbi:hypothetical protein [Caulobacter endophyticus]|uniref:hypothetical protein n=1 Tax=Caulobacter endophyticus TaxID=2172652 RepID=UPI0024107CE3|nr:hypothetical protein [Caulobacter endophyticus]MDG2528383.1 hypothetical protein [Caulobacter endophyticus]
MILMVAFALTGALLGLFWRPRLVGVIVAVVAAGVVQGIAAWSLHFLSQQVNREHLLGQLHAIFGESAIDLAGPVLAAAVGAVFAALLGGLADARKPPVLVTADGIRRQAGKDGRYARMEGMVQDRAIHAKAESRIDSILGL